MTVDQALNQGVMAQREGNLNEAERLYRAILKIQPEHPDANHNLGILLTRVNKTDAALILFKTAFEVNPKIEQFLLSYIDALISRNQLAMAEEIIIAEKKRDLSSETVDILDRQLDSIASKSSSNFSKHNELSFAIDLRETGKYKEAQEWLHKFVIGNPRNPEAFSLLSQLLLLDGQDTEAEKALSKAASISSGLPSIYRNEARLLLKHSKPTKALEKALFACRKAPKDPENLLVVAVCLRVNQRDSEALRLIEKILGAKSSYPEALANRALIRLRANDLTGAIEDAEATVALKPHLSQVWSLLGSMRHQTNNLPGAVDALKTAHDREPKNIDYIISLGELLRLDNKVAEAIIILKRATLLAPKRAEVWINLGVAFQQDQKVDDAKKAYEKALALGPRSAVILSNLGAIARDNEDWESAKRYFEKAVKIQPDLAEAHNNLGSTLMELGRLEAAEISLREAILLKPDYALAYGNLGKVLYKKGQKDAALDSIEKANDIAPHIRDFDLLSTVIKSRKSRETGAAVINDATNTFPSRGLTSNPFIVNRPVEAELIANLYEMSFRELDTTTDARFGTGICSVDFNLFQDNRRIIQQVSGDLIRIMRKAVEAEIYIWSSFFNILRAGSGTTPHKHLNRIDKDTSFNLGYQKYSLVYYISVGDQDCNEPGILKLYDPIEEILPREGMITIIPASRSHSAIYEGNKDRIMIGVNFYSI